MMKENDIHGGLTDLELEKEMLDGELIIFSLMKEWLKSAKTQIFIKIFLGLIIAQFR